MTLTAYMLCGALGMLVGGFVAARTAHSDRVVAIAMAVAAVLLALCGTGLLGATLTMVVLAGTGFAVGMRVLSLVPSHHNHAIGESIGIRLDVDHVVVLRNVGLQTTATG